MSSRASAKTASLPDLRERIDEYNHKILKLLSERARLVLDVARHKHLHGIAVYQPVREREVIDRMISANPGPLTPEHVARIYTEIISACRALEQPLRVAFLGPEHTYSHQAAIANFGSSMLYMPQPSFAEVFSSIENGRAEFGVVPVENSTEGSINLTLDLLIDTTLVIVGEILLPIRHALLSRAKHESDIRKIVSHQQSLAQCRNYLNQNFPGIETEAVASNSMAARRAAEDPTVAAIASIDAGRANDLNVFAENIQDLAQNTTRFLIMGTHPTVRSGADKTTVLFAVPDKVGALNQVLALFARNKINISKIESRPRRGRPWEYLFFVDFKGHREDAHTVRAIAGLGRIALFLKVLGSYPEARTARA